MKFIQTLYFNNSINPFKYSFGWAAPEYHLMGWALSCLQLNKIYGNIDMYCNSEAAYLLRNELGLPYRNYYITHNDLDIANEHLWALPKIHTYSLQDEPFLHFDGDVFLFDRLPSLLLNADLISQNIEEATDYYLQTQLELLKHFKHFPKCVRADFESVIPIKAVNAGILGGSNIDFIKEYTGLAFDYINRNKEYFPLINIERFNVFFEQHLFYSLAKEKGLPIEVLIKECISDNQYMHLGDFHEVPCKRNYLHLLGQYKKDEHTCMLMAAKLRQLYPEYYYRIIMLFRTTRNPVSTSLYNNKKNSTVSDYINFAQKAKDNFSKKVTDEVNTEVIRTNTDGFESLVILRKIIENLNDYNDFSKIEIENDFDLFSENLLEVIRCNDRFNEEYIYGRDLSAVNWFCDLFGNDEEIENKIITKAIEITILKSDFDWSGLLNQHTRVGIKYYELLKLTSGEFNNLVIPEIFGDGFSLHDIDEMEKIILDNLTTPLLIKDLFTQLLAYVEGDIITNHLEEYRQLIILMIKQLVLKKAIMPLNTTI